MNAYDLIKSNLNTKLVLVDETRKSVAYEMDTKDYVYLIEVSKELDNADKMKTLADIIDSVKDIKDLSKYLTIS